MNKKKNKLADNIILDDFYISPRAHWLKLILVGFGLLFLGFFLNFPFGGSLDRQIVNAIKNNRNCPIRYQELDIFYFVPGFEMEKPHFSGVCWGSADKTLEMNKLTLGMRIPSLWPFGLKFKAVLEGKGSEIIAYPLIGPTNQIRIEDSKISSQLLNSFLDIGNILGGHLMANARFVLANNQLSEGKISLTSKNLSLQKGQIKAGALPMQIPNINIGRFVFEGSINKNVLKVDKFILGEPGGKIFAQFKGLINTDRSGGIKDVNLIGELEISSELTSADGPLSILNLLWQIDSQPKTGGIYKVKFEGSVPNAFLKPQFME